MNEPVLESDLTDEAVELCLLLLASASTDKIRPIDWWTRARAALEAGAAAAEDLGTLVSIAGGKLQIDALSDESSRRLVVVKAQLRDRFVALRDLCERQALYVVALAQARRAEEKGQL